MREYIFGHILRGGTPLTGPALVDAIVEVAVALPGYEEWCRHQHEIQQLAGSWARSIEAAPKYYPYDPSKRVVQLAPQSELEASQQHCVLQPVASTRRRTTHQSRDRHVTSNQQLSSWCDR
jgi:hypothetical protein